MSVPIAHLSVQAYWFQSSQLCAFAQFRQMISGFETSSNTDAPRNVKEVTTLQCRCISRHRVTFLYNQSQFPCVSEYTRTNNSVIDDNLRNNTRHQKAGCKMCHRICLCSNSHLIAISSRWIYYSLCALPLPVVFLSSTLPGFHCSAKDDVVVNLV